MERREWPADIWAGLDFPGLLHGKHWLLKKVYGSSGAAKIASYVRITDVRAYVEGTSDMK